MQELYDKRHDSVEMVNLAENKKYSRIIKKMDQQLVKRMEESRIIQPGYTVH